jgi:hypothetical protein
VPEISAGWGINFFFQIVDRIPLKLTPKQHDKSRRDDAVHCMQDRRGFILTIVQKE